MSNPNPCPIPWCVMGADSPMHQSEPQHPMLAALEDGTVFPSMSLQVLQYLDQQPTIDLIAWRPELEDGMPQEMGRYRMDVDDVRGLALALLEAIDLIEPPAEPTP